MSRRMQPRMDDAKSERSTQDLFAMLIAVAVS
jgi:hypothetical protein